MSDTDKNLHLSPLLDKIRDYGPGEEPEEESTGGAEQAPDQAPNEPPATDSKADQEDAEQAPQEPAEPPAPPPVAAAPPAKSSRLAVYSLVLLWLLTLAGGFGAFVWQQTRIDALALELKSERGKSNDLVAAAEREASRLADRVVELDDTVAALRAGLADAQNEAAALAIASVEAVQPQAPAPEVVEEEPSAPAPEPSAQTTEAALVEPQVPATETAVAEQSAPAAPAETQAPPPGSWYINLSTLSSEAAARQWLAGLADAPARTEIIAVQSGGKTLYRVRIGGYASREDALGEAQRLGVSSAWASKG